MPKLATSGRWTKRTLPRRTLFISFAASVVGASPIVNFLIGKQLILVKKNTVRIAGITDNPISVIETSLCMEAALTTRNRVNFKFCVISRNGCD